MRTDSLILILRFSDSHTWHIWHVSIGDWSTSISSRVVMPRGKDYTWHAMIRPHVTICHVLKLHSKCHFPTLLRKLRCKSYFVLESVLEYGSVVKTRIGAKHISVNGGARRKPYPKLEVPATGPEIRFGRDISTFIPRWCILLPCRVQNDSGLSVHSEYDTICKAKTFNFVFFYSSSFFRLGKS
jgi:hypothetical protein